MTQAKCNKCGGSAFAETFELARKLINHAVGLSRGIKCGDSYNMVQEIKSVAKKTPTPEAPKPVVTNTFKPEKTKSSTSFEKPKEKKETKPSFR